MPRAYREKAGSYLAYRNTAVVFAQFGRGFGVNGGMGETNLCDVCTFPYFHIHAKHLGGGNIFLGCV